MEKKIIENELKKDQQSLSLEKKCYEQLQWKVTPHHHLKIKK